MEKTLLVQLAVRDDTLPNEYYPCKAHTREERLCLNCLVLLLNLLLPLA